MTMLGSIKNIRDKALLLKREGSKTRKLVRACWHHRATTATGNLATGVSPETSI